MEIGPGLISAARDAAFSGVQDGKESLLGAAVSPTAVARSSLRKEFSESPIAARPRLLLGLNR
jgi:hypothetical protein